MTFILIVYIFEMASNQSHNPGEFREGRTRELVLEDVTVDAFDVMMRTAYHLEPKYVESCKVVHDRRSGEILLGLLA